MSNRDVSLKGRRDFLKRCGVLSLACLGSSRWLEGAESAKKPNVLFLAIDDLNDWIGCMSGHPDAKTPNFDRLAARGILFTNAHCSDPMCAPSRTALLSGRAPYVTGVYKNYHSLRDSKVLKDAVLLPRHFRDNGYFVTGTGKIFHESDHEPACWDEYWPALDTPNPSTYEPPVERMPLNGLPVDEKAWGNDFGCIPVDNEETGDWKTSGWVAERLKSDKLPEPFFLAWGCKKPHVPLYAPQKYFDIYPIDEITLPVVKEDDWDDIPDAAKSLGTINWHWKPDEAYKKYGKVRRCVQSYLACVSYVDDCLGQVLDALDSSKYRDNTIIVLFTDHGIHKGEKKNWSKYTLWEEATRVPMMIAGPGIKGGKRCGEPVGLIDIYPTLIDLCGLSKAGKMDGASMTPLLAEPDKDFGRYTITSFAQNINCIRTRNCRYIRYDDGSEELYDHLKDPYEWDNLAGRPEYEDIKKELAAKIPIDQVKKNRRRKGK